MIHLPTQVFLLHSRRNAPGKEAENGRISTDRDRGGDFSMLSEYVLT
jgi:hypothetical protein